MNLLKFVSSPPTAATATATGETQTTPGVTYSEVRGYFVFLTLGFLCLAAIHFPGDNWDRPNICRPWSFNYWRVRIRSIQVLFTFDVSCVRACYCYFWICPNAFLLKLCDSSGIIPPSQFYFLQLCSTRCRLCLVGNFSCSGRDGKYSK